MDSIEKIPTPQVGIIGLGMIGGGVAVSLVRSGITPTAVYDIRPDASEKLEGVPAQVATPAEVGRLSDIVMLAVVNTAQARDVLSSEHGLLSTTREGTIIVLLSTVSMQDLRELSGLCESHGAVLLDAGVTGGTKAAENGLVVMLGGSDDVVERAMPALNGFAKAVVHCGPSGTGMVTKLARNAITYGQWALIHEATALAQVGGVAPDRLLKALVEGDDPGTDRLNLLKGAVAGYKTPEERVVSADYLAQKDLGAAQDFAAEMGVETPLINDIRPKMRDVYAGKQPEKLSEDTHARGLEMMDRVYGEGFSQQVPPAPAVPSIDHTVERLFAGVWDRPYLTLRDRRLFTLGITAMLGRADLLETQLRGALANRELTPEQLREIVLHGHYYAGWGNGTVLQGVVEKLLYEASNDLK